MRYLVTGIVSLALCALVPVRPRVEATPQDAPPLPASLQATNDRFVADILRKIACHESDPASQVFQNIQMFKATPARTLLAIMSVGYAPALGVSCTHCHAAGDFASDEKRPKRAAREMQAMHRSINDQLAKMQHLATPATDNRAVNCSVCHRGKVNPRVGG